MLKNMRQAANLTQRDLAEKVGFSRTKIYDLERKDEINEDDLNKLTSVLSEHINLSYVAGLFDRHSSITITKIHPYTIHKNQKSPTYIAKIIFNSRHKILCDTIHKIMNTGSVCPIKNYYNGTDGYSFYAHCESVDIVIEKLLPYLVLKRDKMQCLKEFREFLIESRDAYRASSHLKFTPVYNTEITDTSKWWTVSQTIRTLKKSTTFIYDSLKEKRIKAVKDAKNHWLIHPIDGFEISDKPTMPQEVLDKYEYYYQRIRQV